MGVLPPPLSLAPGIHFRKRKIVKKLIPPGLEPGTFRVLGERDDHYTTEPAMASQMDH